MNERKIPTIEDAIAILKRVEKDLFINGWIAALYGSVSKEGKGRDIDLIVFNKLPQSNISTAIRAFESNGFYMIKGPTQGGFCEGVLFESRERIILDVQFRIAEVRTDVYIDNIDNLPIQNRNKHLSQYFYEQGNLMKNNLKDE